MFKRLEELIYLADLEQLAPHLGDQTLTCDTDTSIGIETSSGMKKAVDVDTSEGSEGHMLGEEAAYDK